MIYINGSKNNIEGTSPVTFRLADLTIIYKEQLEQLGVESLNVHSNRLKDQLIAQMPELESHRKGRDSLLTFKKDIGPVISQASDYSDTIILSKAASILRNQMINHKSKLNGNFDEQCIDDSISPKLLQFVCMVLTLNHSYDLELLRQTWLWHSYCSTIAMVGVEMKKQLKGIPKIVRPLFLVYRNVHICKDQKKTFD